MRNFSRYTCQGFQKCDLSNHQQVSPSSLEDIMFLNRHPGIDITSHYTRYLVALAIKYNIVRIWDSRVDRHLKDLILLLHPLTLASFAFIFFFYHLTSAIATLTTGLSLSHQTGTQLNHSHSYTHTIAFRTFYRITSTFPFTIKADPIPGNCHLLHRPRIDFFQSNLYFNQFWLHFFGSIIFFGVENIKQISSSRRSSVFDPFFTILIIKLSFLRISENIACFFDSMESLGVSTSIGMFFKSFLSECFFDLFGGGIFRNFQQLVKLSSIDFFICFLLMGAFFLALMSSEKHLNKILIYLLILICRCKLIQQMNSKRNLRSKRSYKEGPKSLPSRTLDTTLASQFTIKQKTQSQWTVDKLTTNYIPEEIVGRNEEKQIISNFIQDCILNRINAKVLYISGVPGVGKTASTMQILRKLERQYSRKAKFGFVNALTLKRPDYVYKQILAIMTGEKQRLFKGICHKIQAVLAGLDKSHVIVIDEVDFLITKDQQIFYNLFEWVSNVTSKLGLVIIANTMDFPERLSGKINSRMGNHRLVFKPYSYSQIKQIVDERIQGCKYFASNALTFISKKLSTYSSDIRTILQILHKAVKEHIQLQRKGKITIDTVHQLWEEKMGTIRPQTSKMPSLHLQIIQILKRNDGQSNSLALLEVLSQKGVTQTSLMALLKQLEQQGFVILRQSYRNMFKCFNVKLKYRLSEE